MAWWRAYGLVDRSPKPSGRHNSGPVQQRAGTLLECPRPLFTICEGMLVSGARTAREGP